MVLALRDEYESVYKAALSIGPKVGVKPESLRRWVRGQLDEGTPKAQAALDAREEALVLKELKQKVKELEDANRILLEASIFLRRGNSTPDAPDCDLY
jgi:transposase-like protein